MSSKSASENQSSEFESSVYSYLTAESHNYGDFLFLFVCRVLKIHMLPKTVLPCHSTTVQIDSAWSLALVFHFPERLTSGFSAVLRSF